MRKILKNSQTTNFSVNTCRGKLNASAGLSPELSEMLTQTAKQLKVLSGQLGGLIEDQVMDPTYVEGKDVAADRLLDWTADLFAISEDIEFYVNPEPK